MPEAGIPVHILADALDANADLICQREQLDVNGLRVVERVRWRTEPSGPVRGACVKYGPGPHLLREAAVYTGWIDPRTDPVPNLVSHRALPDDWHVLAIEWLDGRMPDFTDAGDVDAVFRALGEWQAGCAIAIRAGEHLRDFAGLPVAQGLRAECARFGADVRDAHWYERRLTGYLDTFEMHRALCSDLGGSPLLETCAQVRAVVSRLAERIASVPLTLDPGDLSMLNVLILGSGSVRFIDFEYAALAPVSQVFESLGEPWETVPTGDMVERGLRAYTEAWAGAGGVPLTLDDLIPAQRCLRVFRKCFELDADLDQLVTPGCTPDVAAEVRGWAVAVAHDLPPLVGVALPYM